MIRPGDFAVHPTPPDSGELSGLARWMAGDGFHVYQHAVLAIDETHILDTLNGIAQITSLPTVGLNNWVWSDLPLTDTHRNKIVNVAQGLVGTPHSQLDYFAIAARRLGIPDPQDEVKNYLKTEKHMVGPQIVDYCYRQAGVKLFHDGRWIGYVPPVDLLKVIQHPEHVTYGR